MRKVVAFDFDGTITTRDTLLQFILFAKGRRTFFFGFALYSPLLIAFKLKLYPNWKAKQKIFSYFFKGMPHSRFRELGERFADEIDRMTRPKALATIRAAVKEGDRVYVLTASVEEWVRPWCTRLGITAVLGTQVAVDEHGNLTGHFATPNCYGPEKVVRLLAVEPDRGSYILHAFGDSRGDKDLIDFADHGGYHVFK